MTQMPAFAVVPRDMNGLFLTAEPTPTVLVDALQEPDGE
jgi:hypothetical protein